ncbi:MAG: EamA family transporter [Alphaproteobacteria bacterium]|nr:EamA family transporter [Alphaproteobacteria bacterium]NCQ87467.1 EamA family transporter [Alphaproteobacteria bacterium]NCT06338.1 EamA family transporter [Alphaproteobacteria bacterium]
MSWMILASIPPLLWSFSNHIDEYLSKNHFTSSPFLMIVAACLIQIIPGVAILSFHQQAFDLSLSLIMILCALGVFSILCFVPYIKAIQIDGASVAVPIYQTIPVFTFFLAWVFLGETVSLFKIAAAFLIVSAAFAITWNFQTKSISYKTLYLMFLSSFGLGIYNVISRYYLKDGVDWLSMLGWSFIGTAIFGFIAVAVVKTWRNNLYLIVRTGGKHVLILFFIQLALDIAAFSLFIVALSLAPAAGLVSTMNGLQPFYIMVVAALGGYFLPQFFPKAASGKTLVWRLLCVVMLFIGVAVLSLSD